MTTKVGRDGLNNRGETLIDTNQPVGDGRHSRRPRSLWPTAASLVLMSSFAAGVFGQTMVKITAQKTILPTDTTITATAGGAAVPLAEALIVVQGTTLTIDRSDSVTIYGLSLELGSGRPSLLTHTQGKRIDLNVIKDVSVDANSSINVDSKGLAGSQGSGAGQTFSGYNGGGAGYGGAGGDSLYSSQAIASITGLGGICYGFDQANLFGPTALGSGGGNVWVSGTEDMTSGGYGGGAAKLTVGGTLTLNGQILARGGAGTYRGSGSDRSGGGGSGGSVFITANAIDGTGSGSIVVSGGGSQAANGGYGGGGGGGRIAIVSNTTNLDMISLLDVSGGGGYVRGGAGTVYTRLGGATRGTLLIDNNNADIGETTEFYGPQTLDVNLVVRNKARLGPAHGQTDFNLTILGNVQVDGSGYIDADSRGFRGSRGTGQGQTASGYNGGGAGYGGAGGDALYSSQASSLTTGLGGICYGFDQASLFAPTALGSGGGNVWVSGVQDVNSGGFGGGAIRLTVNGTLTLNGQILARGGKGTYRGSGSDRSGGGGSGGSVFITANAIEGTGSGLIVVSGGESQAANGGFGGGGGGGRIAIISNSSTLDGIVSLDASGGSGNSRGGAGTIYTRLGGAGRGTLFIDNNNAEFGENTEFYGPLTLDANLVIRNKGLLGPAHGQTLNLTVLGNVTVDGSVGSQGYINASGRGRRGSTGPGAGLSASGLNGGGAGYGGAGGSGRPPGAAGGPTYGDSILSQLLLGSGGGNAWVSGLADVNSGGFGGGALSLEVRGTLTLNGDGAISASGYSGTYRGSGSDRSGGGGSGGSVFVTATSISGTGSIFAKGGDSQAANGGFGGGGGGGRVVVATCSTSSVTVNVAGGTGYQVGKPGTSIVRTFGFLEQPVEAKTCSGGPASFHVNVAAIGPITYKWRKGGVPINTATNPSAATATLSFTSVVPGDSASYDCVVATGCGNVTSNPAPLTICRVDFDCNGFVNGDDFDAFVAAFELGEIAADYNGDGFVTGDDFDGFSAAFAEGC